MRLANFRTALLFFILLAMGMAAQAITITRKSSPIFYCDFSKAPNLTSMYVAYQITNDTATNYPNVYVTATNFVGGVVTLSTNDNGVTNLGALAPGASKMAFFFLQTTGATLTAQTHDIKVYNGPPSIGTVLLTQSFSFTSVEDVLEAKANKVTTVVSTPDGPAVGGRVVVTVTGHTGTVGGANIVSFTPAAYSSWRADALQLVTTSIAMTGGNTLTLTDTLYSILPSPADTDYVATYTFRATNVVASNIPVSPIGYINSGNPMKHTDDGSFASLAGVAPPIVTTKMIKTVSPASLQRGGTATYTVTMDNTIGTSDVTVDRIVDILPTITVSGTAYAVTYTGTSTYGGVAIADPIITGQQLNWNQPFTVPAGGTQSLVYKAVIPNVSGTYTNSAVAYVETAQIDSDLVLTGSAPAFVNLVVESANLSIVKSGTNAALTGQNIAYTLSYQNLGPTAASNVVLSDTLPTGMSFISATGISGSTGVVTTSGTTVVTWPTIPSLASGGSGNYVLTVTSSISGPLTDKAAITADTLDSVPANNTSQLTTTVSPATDIAVFKTGPATAVASGTINYVVTVVNQGVISGSNVVVSDVLPPSVTSPVVSGSGVISSGTVTWPTIPTLAVGGSASYTVSVVAPSLGGTLTNIAKATTTTTDLNAANNNGTQAASQVVTTVPVGVTLSGFVYSDTNSNSTMDNGEAGTGQTLYAKLMSSGTGPVVSSTSVNVSTGAYSFPAVVAGTWIIIVDTNNTAGDVTATYPAGWVGTEMSTGKRTVAVSSQAISGLNFGVDERVLISGKVFTDTGLGVGTANDGTLNGGEQGLGGALVRITNNAGSIVYSSTTSAADGTFSLYVSSTIPNGTSLKLTETNLPGYISTGASVGSTSGTYDRATDSLTFTFNPASNYSGILLGDIPAPILDTDGSQSGMPGTVLFYPHTFIANSAGTVTFSTAAQPNPSAVTGWAETIFNDLNGNGKFDPGEPMMTGTTVTAGQAVKLLVKEFIPAAAPYNATNKVTLTAVINYNGASPALSTTLIRVDQTTVGERASALVLVKSVDKQSALPGERLTYKIVYSNNSPDPLSNVVIYDTTPAFTTFVSSTWSTPLPATLTGATPIAPAVGSAGNLQWTFTGQLQPAVTGTITFQVNVAQ